MNGQCTYCSSFFFFLLLVCFCFVFLFLFFFFFFFLLLFFRHVALSSSFLFFFFFVWVCSVFFFFFFFLLIFWGPCVFSNCHRGNPVRNHIMTICLVFGTKLIYVILSCADSCRIHTYIYWIYTDAMITDARNDEDRRNDKDAGRLL